MKIKCPKCKSQDFKKIDNDHCKCKKCGTHFSCEMLKAQDTWNN